MIRSSSAGEIPAPVARWLLVKWPVAGWPAPLTGWLDHVVGPR